MELPPVSLNFKYSRIDKYCEYADPLRLLFTRSCEWFGVTPETSNVSPSEFKEWQRRFLTKDGIIYFCYIDTNTSESRQDNIIGFIFTHVHDETTVEVPKRHIWLAICMDRYRRMGVMKKIFVLFEQDNFGVELTVNTYPLRFPNMPGFLHALGYRNDAKTFDGQHTEDGCKWEYSKCTIVSFSSCISTDWYGCESSYRPSFILSVTRDLNRRKFICLQVRVSKPSFLKDSDNGTFRAGLWDGDCAELFLGNPVTGFYVEFNVSPIGGWWNCSFSSIRVKAHDKDPEPLSGVWTEGTADPSDNHWTAGIYVPVDSLPSELDFNAASTQANVTFCIYDKSNPLSVNYFSHTDLRNTEGLSPDFHRPFLWKSLHEHSDVINNCSG